MGRKEEKKAWRNADLPCCREGGLELLELPYAGSFQTMRVQENLALGKRTL